MSPVMPRPPVVTGRSDAGDGLEILGSAIDADPAELRSLAQQIEASAGTVSGAAGRLRAAEHTIEATTTWAATSGRRAQSETHMARLELLTANQLADELADDLRQAAAAYAEAEERAREAFVSEVPRVGTEWGPVFGPMARLLRVPVVIANAFGSGASRGQWTPSAPQMGEMLEELTYYATGGPLYPDWAPLAQDRLKLASVMAAWATTAAVVVPRGFTPHGVEVSRVRRGTCLASPAPEPNHDGAAGVADLMTGIGDLYEAQAVPEGTVRVDRITTAEGQTFWQVYIPGTQTQTENVPLPLVAAPGLLAHGMRNTVANDVPQDWATNLNAFAGMPSSVENGVVQALEDAGVGEGEPVLFAGHSQGAMIAMSLASDTRIRTQYDVESVVTFGGPVGHMQVPPDVSVLNVEHRGDLVAGLENTPNPVEPNRFTVRRDLAASADPADADVNSVVQAHDIPAYVRTAGLIDQADSPVLASWRAQSREVMVDGGAQASGDVQVDSQYFTMRRERWMDLGPANWFL